MSGSKLKYTVSPRGITKSKSETGMDKKYRTSDGGGTIGRGSLKRNTHDESSESSPVTPGRSSKGSIARQCAVFILLISVGNRKTRRSDMCMTIRAVGETLAQVLDAIVYVL